MRRRDPFRTDAATTRRGSAHPREDEGRAGHGGGDRPEIRQRQGVATASCRPPAEQAGSRKGAVLGPILRRLQCRFTGRPRPRLLWRPTRRSGRLAAPRVERRGRLAAVADTAACASALAARRAAASVRAVLLLAICETAVALPVETCIRRRAGIAAHELRCRLCPRAATRGLSLAVAVTAAPRRKRQRCELAKLACSAVVP